jgi:alkanesulfonate monooxygenase SsuD/methylene tetrahydromethanopterin reductase-like flavin-dependent oxidoreductase (luciferase family)
MACQLDALSGGRMIFGVGAGAVAFQRVLAFFSLFGFSANRYACTTRTLHHPREHPCYHHNIRFTSG